MMSPLLIEKLAECMHADRQADAEATRLHQHAPARSVSSGRPRFVRLGAALTCLAGIAGAIIVVGGLPHQF